MYRIYALADPCSPLDFRYVGWATDTRRRLLRHIAEAKKLTDSTHRLNWIRSVLTAGRVPTMVVIADAATRAEANRLERKHIKLYRRAGHDLTNGSDGGDGVRPTASVRAKMSASQQVRWRRPEEHAKMSAAKSTPASLLLLAQARERAKNAQTRRKLSASIAALWREPGYRAKQLADRRRRRNPSKWVYR